METLAKIGLTRPGVDKGLEQFSMMRQGWDMLASYSEYDELKQLRSSYLTHILDHVLKERHLVHLNN